MGSPFSIKIPMLSLAASKGKKKEDKDTPVDNYKPPSRILKQDPSKKEMATSAIHDEMRNSMRDWVAGRKTTKEHKETMRRGGSALEAVPTIREGKY